jgi:hypothetical protein
VTWFERSLYESGTPTPAPTSVADLAAWAPGDNVHVLATEFGFAENYVFTKNQNQASWQSVWIPLLPPEGRKGIRVVAHTGRVKNEADLAQFVQRTTLRGVMFRYSTGFPTQEF